METEEKEDQEDAGMNKYRQQCGLDICKLDNGRLRMNGIWPPEDCVSRCAPDSVYKYNLHDVSGECSTPPPFFHLFSIKSVLFRPLSPIPKIRSSSPSLISPNSLCCVSSWSLHLFLGRPSPLLPRVLHSVINFVIQLAILHPP